MRWKVLMMLVVATLAALAMAAVYGSPLYVVAGPPPGTRPVWRYWNNKTGHHFFTIDAAERAWLEENYSHVMVFEGVAFYAWPDANGVTP